MYTFYFITKKHIIVIVLHDFKIIKLPSPRARTQMPRNNLIVSIYLLKKFLGVQNKIKNNVIIKNKKVYS